MAYSMPDKLTNFEVYLNGDRYLGVASIDLPQLNYVRGELNGAGMTGPVDTPVQGHFQSMQITIHWHTVLKAAIEEMMTQGGTITCMGSQQEWNTGTNVLEDTPVKFTFKYVPHSMNFNSFTPGTDVDATTELEITYMKLESKGEVNAEIDKFNYVCVIGGVDLMEKVRQKIGV